MADKTLKAENLGELQIWIEGKFDLIAQAQKTAHEDLTQIRQRTHDLGNELAKVAALGLSEKVPKLISDVDALKTTEASRRGAMSALKAAYLVAGAALGTVATILLKLVDYLK